MFALKGSTDTSFSLGDRTAARKPEGGRRGRVPSGTQRRLHGAEPRTGAALPSLRSARWGQL